MEKSMDTFLKYDGSISLADASSIEIMKKHGVKKIISFDSDFDKINEIDRSTNLNRQVKGIQDKQNSNLILRSIEDRIGDWKKIASPE